MKARTSSTGMLLLILMFIAVNASSQTLHYSGSAQFSVGDYIFSEQTNSLYLANQLGLSHQRFAARLTVPVVRQNSPWVSYTTAGSVSTGGPAQGEVRGRGDQSGQGRRGGDPITVVDTSDFKTIAVSDPSLTLSFSLLNDMFQGRSVQVRGSAKAPVSQPDDGFGTGAWDYSLGVSAMRRLRRAVVFVDVAYWVLGDMEELSLNNSLSYGLSFGRSLGDGSDTVLASFSGSTVIVPGTEPALLVGLGLGHSFDSGNGVSANASIGLTESAPNVSVGVGWRIGLKKW
ncbi:MAG: hypothetical protein HKN43_16730 [Rhodothermales bacterium]|nr:hypothetical protein [Rhodothermales bacterium]